MALPVPNAYDATILRVVRLSREGDPVKNRVTWRTNGREYSANTIPGGDANRQVENRGSSPTFRIITNGRSQIIAVEPNFPKES